MTDITPITNAAVEIGATLLMVFGAWAANSLKNKLNLDVSASQTAAFDDALNKAVTFAATQSEMAIKAKGWDSPDVKSVVLATALSSIAEKAPDALAGVGLSTDINDPANRERLTHALQRALPSAFTTAAASPATPPSTVIAVSSTTVK